MTRAEFVVNDRGGTGDGDRRAWWALGAWALAYGVLHHAGFALSRLGRVGTAGTTWADWIDLAIPYAVLVPAAVAVVSAAPTPRLGWLLLVGAIAYADGHGIHVAANSVGNVDPSPAAHLWDEVVGHYVWYAGTALVMAALVLAFARLRPPPSVGRAGPALALLVGVTWATNGLEGGTVPLTAAFAAGLADASSVMVRRGRMTTGLARLVWCAFVPALVVLAVYGLLNGGFPQPSDR